jgi:SAM-dependent methyltransferase
VRHLPDDLTLHDIRAHELRGSDFYRGILGFREKILAAQEHRIQPREAFHCTLCQSPEGELFLTWRAGYELLRCHACGAVSPNLSFEDSPEYDAGVYENDAYWEKFEREIHAQFDYRLDRFGRERVRYVVDRLGLEPTSVRVLDVGCGAGYFLAALEERGISCRGLELNARVAAYARRRGLDVVSADVADEPDGAWDVITLFDVLEHLPNPVATLRTLCGKLGPGGFIVAFTPNIHSLAYELMGASQNTMLPFEHLCFFDRGSLEWLARESGFALRSLETYGLDVMDYLLMKEHEDGHPYTERLHEMMVLVQACLDRLGVSNHFRITFQGPA